ncbi:MAG: SoxR reducing system RseC family protein [Planctomycetes bacterium]|nr:SoxR reducing system RseC family protein [Planctomycetota bacterium]
MKETGVVLSIGRKKMDVRMDAARPEICKQCHACESLGGGKEMRLHVPRVEGIEVGDQVAVEVPRANPWLSIVLVLGLPIAAGVAGLQLGMRWAWWTDLLGIDPELCGAILGLICGIAVFQAARIVDHRYFRRIKVVRLGSDAIQETE